MSMITIVYAVPQAAAERLEQDADFFDEVTQFDNSDFSSCSLEKAWHGLHFLLTGQADEASAPLGFILSGGKELPETDGGYGPARLFTADETRDISAALSALSGEQLWSRFDETKMTDEGVYPSIWDEPEADLRDEYVTYFRELRKFLKFAAADGACLLVTLG